MLGNIQKTLSVICFVLLGIALIIAYNNPASGYELDIYDSTPFAFWFLVIASILIGASIIVTQVITNGYEKSKIWLLGLMVILSSRMVLLYFPYIRGYISWRGDNVAYLGITKDIITNGGFSAGNVYPVTHVYLSGIINTTNLPDIIVANFSTGVLSILSVLFVYVLAGILTSNKRIQILSTLVAGIIILAAGYNVILSPNGWSIFFLPLLLYLYLKQDILEYKIQLVIVLVMYPFFHPLSSLIVIVMLVVIEIIKPILHRYLKDGMLFNSQFNRSTFLPCIIIELAIFGMWMLGHTDFHLNLKILWQEIMFGMNTGKLGELTSSLDKLDIHGLDFIVLLIKMFGSDIILLLIMGIGIPLLLCKRFSDDEIDKTKLLVIISVIIVCGVLYVGYLGGMPGTTVLAGGQWDRRILGYINMLLPVFAGILLSRILAMKRISGFIYYSKENGVRLFKQVMSCAGAVILVVLVIVSSLLSIRSLYSSPFISQPNIQITGMDLKGTEWLLENVDKTLGIDYVASPPEDFAMALVGREASSGKTGLKRYTNSVIDNFGYNEQSVIGSHYTSSCYLVITEYDKIAYTSIWKEVGRFSEYDFISLDNDASLYRLYSNRGMNIYYINPEVVSEVMRLFDWKIVR